MFHAGRDHMIACGQDPFDPQIQGFGRVLGEHDLFRFFDLKKMCDLASGTVDFFSCFHGHLMSGAAGIAAVSEHAFLHGGRHDARLRIGCRSVIKIYHRISSLHHTKNRGHCCPLYCMRASYSP